MVLIPVRRPVASRTGAGIAAAIVLTVGCSTSDTTGTQPETARLVATTTVWADITSRVACGAPVDALVPAGADPHTYEVSLRDREAVTGASVLVANGAGLEASAGVLVDAAVDAGVAYVVVTDHLDLLDADEHDDEHDDERDDERGDPHVWLDPTLVIDVVDEIEAVLVESGFETCADDVETDLARLDQELAETLADVAPSDRILVTGHDSLAYFAERYDFEVLGAVIPSTSTLAEPSAGELADLAELIEDRSVRAIFTDAFETAVDADALGERLGIPVVALATGSVTDEAPTYAAMMTANARAIADALA
ncbi:MAG: metal ABC transporter substrate-binding protein [Ilumatobacteraceae bacterium]